MPTTDELQQQIDALIQRVDAITAPPTDYYVHQYSGEEIDDAVAKISGSTGLVSSFNGRTGAVMPAAGDYTAAMVGAAPEGYGLGKRAGKIITDCNEATEGGWYYFGADSLNTPELILNHQYGALLVVPRNTNLTQLYYNPIITCYMAVRIKSNSGWEPWEYINPPMSPGVEYRTVERYQGNPVYRKLVNFGALPNATAKSVAHGIDVSYNNFISIRGMARGGDIIEFPVVNNGNLAGYAYIAGSNLIVKTSINLSAYTAVFELKYWKPVN